MNDNPRLIVDNGEIGAIDFDFFQGEGGIVVNPIDKAAVSIAIRMKRPPLQAAGARGFIGGRLAEVVSAERGVNAGFVHVRARYIEEAPKD